MQALGWLGEHTSRHVREHMLAIILVTVVLFGMPACAAVSIPYGEVKAATGMDIVYGLQAATKGTVGTFIYYKDIADGGRAFLLGWPQGNNYEWIAFQGNSFASALRAAVPLGGNKAAPETLSSLLNMIESPSSGWQLIPSGAIPATMAAVVDKTLLMGAAPLMGLALIVQCDLDPIRVLQDRNIY